MASIEKMSIVGIRSYSPDQKQFIQFFTPLTLILGPNGTGKTTVIESLRYVTTGLFPPGGSGGSAFVHDPKVAHEIMVRGQVGLQFKDVSRKHCVVNRTIEATQNKKNVSIKTLDCTITRKGRDGAHDSVTSKCADLNKEMVSMLGVSRAVLENVIFCHQEDSNWPLAEGKKVKEKFDEIFASTRYRNALNVIKDTNKAQAQIIKEYKLESGFLKQKKMKAEEIRDELADKEQRLESSKDTVKKINNSLKPISEKLTKINTQYNEIHQLQTKIEKFESEKKQMERAEKDLEDNIENEFKGSLNELKQELRGFQDKVKERQEALSRLEQKLAQVTREGDKLSREKSKVLPEFGKLEMEADNQRQYIEQRNRAVRDVAAKYGFQGYSGEVTDRSFQKFLELLKGKLTAVNEEGKNIKDEFDEKESALQKELVDVRGSKSRLEEGERMKRTMVVKNENEIKNLNLQLSKVAASAAKLDDLKRALKRAERELAEAESSVDTDKIKEEIEELQNQKKVLDADYKQLDAEMSRMSFESCTRATLEQMRKEKTSKEEHIRKLKIRNEDHLKHLLPDSSGQNIRRLLDDCVAKLSGDVRKLQAALGKKNVNISAEESSRKMLMEQLKAKEAELRGHEETVYEVCESQDFDDGLEKVKDQLQNVQKTRGMLLGSEYFFGKYVDQLETDERDPCCPLCHRGFDENSEIQELISELNRKMSLVPSQLEQKEKELRDLEAKHTKMVEMRPLRATICDLTDNVIPKLKRDVEVKAKLLTKLKGERQELEASLEMKQGDETMAKNMQPDIVVMDRAMTELRDLNKKIDVQSAKLSGGDEDRTMQQVSNEKDEVQIKLETVGRNLEHKREKREKYQTLVNSLSKTVNELSQEKLQIDQQLQQRNKLQENKEQLVKDNHTYKDDIEMAQQEQRPLQTQIKKLTDDMDMLRESKESRVDEVRIQFQKIKTEGKEIADIENKIKRYITEQRDVELEKCREKKEDLEDKILSNGSEKVEVEQDILKIKDDLATQQIRERELSDNLNLRKKQSEIVKVKDSIATLREDLGDLNPGSLDRDQRKLRAEEDSLLKEKHTADGRQRGLEEEIRTRRKELNSDYKDADQIYTDKVISLRTTELAKGDLDKFYKALDRAVMTYHKMKMDEINKIIRDIWRNTYRGNDIDTIEIRSEDETAGATATSRRNYHYRVVMVKGDTALDMKGRCSAGQKVLASLIIRLALAETFCINCGILALDEPTTNLDRENIESLAFALVEIIKSRHQQRNFQLVIITHDEDFVELLGRSDYVEFFHRVAKNEDGHSVLSKTPVEKLQSR